MVEKKSQGYLHLGGGGGYSLVWPTQGCVTGQGMVFWPSCPEQGI